MMIIRIRKGYFTSAALLGAAISVVGCAGDLPPAFETQSSSGSGSGTSGSGSGSSSSGCADVPKVTFPTKCGTMKGCHIANPGIVVYGLDLVSPNVASRLVGVKSGEPAMAMVPAGTLLIDPASPDKSAIYTKVTGNPPYGLQMPFIPPYLDDMTQACLLKWVRDTAAAAPPSNSFGSDASTTTTDAGKGGGATNGG
jgi:hypothetical protein